MSRPDVPGALSSETHNPWVSTGTGSSSAPAAKAPDDAARPHCSEHALGIGGEVDRWHKSLTGDRRAAAGHGRDLVWKL